MLQPFPILFDSPWAYLRFSLSTKSFLAILKELYLKLVISVVRMGSIAVIKKIAKRLLA